MHWWLWKQKKKMICSDHKYRHAKRSLKMCRRWLMQIIKLGLYQCLHRKHSKSDHIWALTQFVFPHGAANSAFVHCLSLKKQTNIQLENSTCLIMFQSILWLTLQCKGIIFHFEISVLLFCECLRVRWLCLYHSCLCTHYEAKTKS